MSEIIDRLSFLLKIRKVTFNLRRGVKYEKNNKGFTLAEMLIVVAIIGVLISILVPSFTTQLEKSRETTDAANIRSAISECLSDALTGESDSATKEVILKQKEKAWKYVTTIAEYATTSTSGLSDADSGKTMTIKCDASGNVSFEIKEVGNCLSAGTKIAMSDGTLKNIEDIVEGDVVLTFNHEEGVFEPQRIFLAWKSENQKRPFTLHFTNDISISVIGDHDFFEQESLKYVAIFEENADDFIGKHFYNAINNQYEELLSVTYEDEAVDYYEIYTEYNFNCIAESMLNLPYDSSEVLDIYKFNEDLSIDRGQLERDIEEFGLFEYDVNAPYSKEIYDILNWKYANIMVGKGLGTWEEFDARRDDFLNNY